MDAKVDGSFIITVFLERIYMISMGSIVTSGALLQSHLLSTTTMKRLLLGICCMTKDLQRNGGRGLSSPPAERLSYFRRRRQAIPETAVAVDVACRFFDGAFRDKGRVFCVTRNHHGFTSRPLSCTWSRQRRCLQLTAGQ